MLCDFIVDNHAEVNGYTARLTLIRITLLLNEEGPYEESTSNRVPRMLKNLCYIQELAYARVSMKPPKHLDLVQPDFWVLSGLQEGKEIRYTTIYGVGRLMVMHTCTIYFPQRGSSKHKYYRTGYHYLTNNPMLLNLLRMAGVMSSMHQHSTYHAYNRRANKII